MDTRPSPLVALDAMGGDHAPEAVVDGAVAAAADGVAIVLVGPSGPLGEALGGRHTAGLISVVDAPEVVRMDEEGAVAVRSKRDSSIRVAARLVADGEADALVSAGPTGATLAAALLEMGRSPGIRRPAVGVVLPVGAGGVVLVDAGGSPDVQPDALVDHARMGLAYARVRGVAQPRLGLLNVGAEPGKGNALARQAFPLLEALPEFVGNVEPEVVLGAGVEVVVTDGFTGNVFLKTVEAAAGMAGRTPRAGALGDTPGDTLGGAVLLGVAGEVVVAHGAAREDDIAAAVRSAAQVAQAGLHDRIAAQLSGVES